MKNALKYLKLWQKKRSEMQVSDDPKADWLQLQSLLDEQMPAEKRSSGFKGFKILPTMFIAFSAAAMVYMVSNIVSLEKNKHSVEHNRHHSARITSGSIVADSLNAIDSLNVNVTKQLRDSAVLTGQTASAQDSSSIKPHTDNTKVNTAASANNNKNSIVQASGNHIAGTVKDQNQKPSAHTTFRQGAALAGTLSASGRHHTGIGRTAAGGTNIPGVNSITRYHFPSAAPTSNNRIVDDAISHNIKGTNDNSGTQDVPLMLAVQPQLNFSSIGNIQQIPLPALRSSLTRNTSGQAQTGKTKKDKTPKVKNNNLSHIDWGILTGVNSSGSFTPKNQNANFYGSFPVDVYFGLFASYKLNATWEIAPQLRLFSPQNIITTYSHANQSKVDSNQNLTITSSRKVYAVSVPIYAVYNATSNLSIKAGPVINFPVKQINANSLLQPAAIKADSAYYANINGILNKTQYDQKLNFGISAGASYKYKRFIFEATYLKSLSGYGVTSGLGSYKSYNGTFQFTVGFQLNKVKP
ncbi:outer membrane beta-barrel protein [uncultured Mucilaginibacter sp.]|uniref:outer membrane beta-barrel protein n=1 Tax=uncultured Mucilaginibacter sp. TaxID=797541 RepID=UPI0025D592C7|nr:outer membrane beta-barrel protein [uncultured Mucilaginibacter sp.]